MKKVIKRAKVLDIVKRSLRECYLDGMVIASSMRYRDFWARDTFFALPGIIKIGDIDVARKSIKRFLEYQRPDGKIPRKIVRNRTSLIYIFNKHLRLKKLKPVYRGIVPLSHSTDGNALLIIAAYEYLKKTKDKQFIEQHYERLHLSMMWYRTNRTTGFVHSYFLSDWMDSIFKVGPVLYSNILYCQALFSMSELAHAIGNNSDNHVFQDEYIKIKTAINAQFWNGEFFSNRSDKRSGRFDSAGNVLACYYHIADADKRKIVAKKIIKISGEGKLLPVVFPQYPFWRINPLFFVLAFTGYHNRSSWLWIDLFAVRVLKDNGQEDFGQDMEDDIYDIVLRDETVGEIYFCDGRVYEEGFWKSVSPFAWSSGVFIETIAPEDFTETQFGKK